MNARDSLVDARDLAKRTLSQGADWEPYEEAWHPIALALIRAVDALQEIANADYRGNRTPESEAAWKALNG